MSFEPYSMNGGTIVGIAGEDYALIASDTRLCEESYYLIHSRDHPHVYKLGDKLMVGSVGFQGDTLTLQKILQMRVKMYRFEHGKNMSTNAMAAMLATILYSRRFFPYYVYNLVAGLDEEGKGALYSYDPVGSYEREVYRAGGSSSSIIQPFLDSQVGLKNQYLDAAGTQRRPATHLSKEAATKLVHDVFISAAERDIHCGDSVAINVITKDGVHCEVHPLRKD